MSRLWSGFDTRERTLAATLAATVVFSAQAVGTVHAITLVVMTLLAVGGLWIASRAGRGADRGGLGYPVFIMAGLTVWCLVQALPLPISVLAHIAPANADIWSRTLTPLGGEVTVGHISLDPGASLREALKGVLYVATFVTASRLSASRGPQTGVTIAFASAVLVALVSLLHWLFGATSVFGVYTPVNPIASLRVGPLLNPNNLAGYLNLGLLCGLGLICSRKPPASVGIIGVGIAIVVAMTVRAGSRGGLLVLPLGLIAFAVGLSLIRRRRKETRSLMVPAIVIAGSVAFGVGLAIMGADTTMWADYSSESLDKLTVIGWVRAMVADHPWLGIGRGSFESVFPAYRPVGVSGPHTVFTHAENVPAQWAAEWGVVVGLGALLAFAYLFRPARLHVTRTSVATGAWLAVAVLLVQNLADLSLELAGVAVAMVAVLGTLWGSRRPSSTGTRSESRERAPERRQRPVPMWVVPSFAGAAVALSSAVLAWGQQDIATTRHELTTQLAAVDASDRAARESYRQALRAALLQHPADPHLPLLGGVLAWRARDQSPMPWIQRSLERGLMNGRAHLLLAEVLASRGANQQALLELRWALRSEPQLVKSVSAVTARLAKDIEDVRTAAPEGSEGVQLLVQVSDWFARDGRIGLADQCDQEALARDESLSRVRLRMAERRFAHLEDPELCESPEQCREEILRHAGRLEELESKSSLGAQLRARLLLLDGASKEADALLDEACKTNRKDRAPCLMLQVQIVAGRQSHGDAGGTRRNEEKLGGLLEAYTQERCRSAAECANTHRWVGSIRAGRGQWGLAVIAYEKAAKLEPTTRHLELLADAAEKGGRYDKAIDACERLQKMAHDEERQKRIVTLKAKIASSSGTPFDPTSR